MTPKLSDDIERFVASDSTGIVKVEGANGTYYVMTEEAMRIRQQVQEGLADIERGNVSPWNTADIIEKARRIKEQRSA